MATTHVFIVNSDSFPIHLNYMFAGTGAKEVNVHYGLLADISRVRPGDLIIFYMERVGFYGVFEAENYAFRDTNKPTYLLNELKKKLIYRISIKPKNIYRKGVSEWEALDKLPLYAQDVIWSLIYRKLKGWRGCTPINLQESERLLELLKDANKDSKPIELKTGMSLSFDNDKKEIYEVKKQYRYKGTKTINEDIVKEIIKKDKKNRAYEDCLQIFFTQNIGRKVELESITGKPEEIEWIGNEVYCGFGMQKIDIFTILRDARLNKTFNVIELKCIHAYPKIVSQLKRYADWCSVYIKGAINSNIQPVVVTRKNKRMYKKNGKPFKEKILRDLFIESLRNFNALNISKEARWFEFFFNGNKILFEEVNYST